MLHHRSMNDHRDFDQHLSVALVGGGSQAGLHGWLGNPGAMRVAGVESILASRKDRTVR